MSPRDEPMRPVTEVGATYGSTGGPILYYTLSSALDNRGHGVAGVVWTGMEDDSVGFDPTPAGTRAEEMWASRLRRAIANGSHGAEVFDYLHEKAATSSTYRVGHIRQAPDRATAMQNALADPVGQR